MQNSLPLDYLLNAVRALARVAGAATLEVYHTRFAATEKEDKSPLTEADLRSHACIVEGLREVAPQWPILSEEGVLADYATRSSWNTYWLIDPLDGTREFIRRNGEFTVNIALIHEHVPILGVVLCPVTQVLYSGAMGLGAFQETEPHTRRSIEVARTVPSPPRVVTTRSHGTQRLQQALTALGPQQRMTMGSSLKLCLIAAGEADLYPRLGPTSEWDTAAAHAVVAAAGGEVYTLDGQPLRYNTKESLLNPDFLVCAGEPQAWLARLGLVPHCP